MLLSWWCPFKIKKRKWPTRHFEIIYRLIPLLTPVSCRWTVPLRILSTVNQLIFMKHGSIQLIFKNHISWVLWTNWSSWTMDPWIQIALSTSLPIRCNCKLLIAKDWNLFFNASAFCRSGPIHIKGQHRKFFVWECFTKLSHHGQSELGTRSLFPGSLSALRSFHFHGSLSL